MFIGSVRQITWVAVLCASAITCASAQTNPARTLVSPEQAAAAMRAAGFDTSADKLQMLSAVTTNPDATLRVVKVVTASSGKVLAELACNESSGCLPFYVLAAESTPAAVAMPREIHNNPTVKVSATRTQPLVVRGQPVTLIIESTDLRITLPAICLEGGLPGQTIRVASPDRKRIYHAEIVNKATVRSTL